MANNIDGPLYYERMGRTGPVMAFVHPNPMDQSCWIFQMAQMSTWFRCIAIDGRIANAVAWPTKPGGTIELGGSAKRGWNRPAGVLRAQRRAHPISPA